MDTAQTRRDNPALRRMDTYPVHVTTRVLYSDTDHNKHVNNVAFSRWFEEGRVDLHSRVFGPVFGAQRQEQHMVLAGMQLDFLASVSYPGDVTICTGVERVGSSSFGIAHALFHNGVCCALATSVLVALVDDRPAPLPAEQRAALESLRTS